MHNQGWLSGIFTFTRSEIRGLIILFILIGGLLLFRFLLHRSSLTPTLNYLDLDSLSNAESNNPNSVYTFRPNSNSDKSVRSIDHVAQIDPNSASYGGMVKSGIPAIAAKQIIVYRNKGGSFTGLEDLLKFYGIDSVLLYQLSSALVFKSQAFLADDYSTFANNRPTYVVELNSSDTADFVRLPGIGSVLSARIIKYRNTLGGYYSTDQLKEVYGISDSLFASLKMHLTVDTTFLKKIGLNSVSVNELEKHPYLNHYQVKAIIGYRRLSGPFTRTTELLENYLIPEEIYHKIEPYLMID